MNLVVGGMEGSVAILTIPLGSTFPVTTEESS